MGKKERKAGVEMYTAYAYLTSLADRKDPVLLEFLREKGYYTSKGAGWASCVLRFTADKLDSELATIKNIQLVAGTVTKLTEAFGRGIILLLPRNAINGMYT